jgi:hypothetical protein
MRCLKPKVSVEPCLGFVTEAQKKGTNYLGLGIFLCTVQYVASGVCISSTCCFVGISCSMWKIRLFIHGYQLDVWVHCG